MNNTISTPIQVDLVENKISLNNFDTSFELIEENTYLVQFFTDKDISNCQLVMKRKGGENPTNELLTADSSLRSEIMRYILVNEIDGVSKEYWGILKFFKEEKTEGSAVKHIYKADLFEYSVEEKIVEIPTIKKKNSVLLKKVGEISGELGVFKGTNTEEKLTFTSINGEQTQPSIKFELSTDPSLIPNPPQIDDQIIVSDTIGFSDSITINTEENESFIINFSNFELDFAFYDKEKRIYYFKKTYSFEDKTPGLSNEKIVTPIDGERITISDVSFKYDASNTDLAGEKDNYSSVTGQFDMVLELSEDNLSDYKFQFSGKISFTTQKSIPAIDDNGDSSYKIPKLEFITQKVQAVELDGDGKIITEEIDEYLEYETDDEKIILDNQGLKIPVIPKKEGMIVNKNGNAIIEEETDDEKIMSYYKPLYELDEEGYPVYEYILIPKYKRDENGKILYETINKNIALYETNEETGEKIFETNYDGSYIYNKILKPVYELDENTGERIVDEETGEYKIIYELDDEGNKIIDQDAITYVYETTETGELIFDENGIKIPKFLRGEIFNFDSEGNVEQKKNTFTEEEKENGKNLIKKIKYHRNSDGSLIYEYFLIPKYQRNEDGTIKYVEVVDEGEESVQKYIALYELDEITNEIKYEQHPDGTYIYLKKPMPYYAVDVNQERKIENGEYVVEYEKNGTGEPKRDENGNLILLYEKNEFGQYVLDGDGKYIPVYEKIEIDGQTFDRIEVVGFKPKLDTQSGEDYVYEENPVKSNLLPKYERIIINDIEYYDSEKEIVTIESETEGEESSQELVIVKLKETMDENNKPVYEIDSGTGDFKIIEGAKQEMVLGNSIQEEEFSYTTETNIDSIDYSRFSYSEKDVDKSEFNIEKIKNGNLYTGTIPSSFLPILTEKIAIGLREVKVDPSSGISSTLYATNAIELKIGRSIETFTWDS